MKNLVLTLIFLSIITLSLSCQKDKSIDYRHEMRKFVVGISRDAKSQNPDFKVIVQNGVELICTSDDSGGELAAEYVSAIDGQGQEDLFFGYSRDDKATPESTTEYLKSYLLRLLENEKLVLVTDYCSSAEKIEHSRLQNSSAGFVSFQATSRELDVIPPNAPQDENPDSITDFPQVKNFLYLINSENYPTRKSFVQAICSTNYDLVIVDLFHDGVEFSPDEVGKLRRKANGSRRMVLAYMSIGEAEDYRYYWNSTWKRGSPSWLDKENPNWKGNYKVHYWDSEWQSVIFGNAGSYLSRIIAAGFDGVYLDIIDAFEYYE